MAGATWESGALALRKASRLFAEPCTDFEHPPEFQHFIKDFGAVISLLAQPGAQPPPEFQRAALHTAGVVADFAAAAGRYADEGLVALSSGHQAGQPHSFSLAMHPVLLQACHASTAASVLGQAALYGRLGFGLSAADVYRVASCSICAINTLPFFLHLWMISTTAVLRQSHGEHPGPEECSNALVMGDVSELAAGCIEQTICALRWLLRYAHTLPASGNTTWSPQLAQLLRSTTVRPANVIRALGQVSSVLSLMGPPPPGDSKHNAAVWDTLNLVASLLDSEAPLLASEGRAMLATETELCAQLADIGTGAMVRLMEHPIEAQEAMLLRSGASMLMSKELLPHSLALVVETHTGSADSGSSGSGSGGSSVGRLPLLQVMHQRLQAHQQQMLQQQAHQQPEVYWRQLVPALLVAGAAAHCLWWVGMAVGLASPAGGDASLPAIPLSEQRRRHAAHHVLLQSLRLVPLLLDALAAAEPLEVAVKGCMGDNASQASGISSSGLSADQQQQALQQKEVTEACQQAQGEAAAFLPWLAAASRQTVAGQEGIAQLARAAAVTQLAAVRHLLLEELRQHQQQPGAAGSGGGSSTSQEQRFEQQAWLVRLAECGNSAARLLGSSVAECTQLARQRGDQQRRAVSQQQRHADLELVHTRGSEYLPTALTLMLHPQLDAAIAGLMHCLEEWSPTELQADLVASRSVCATMLQLAAGCSCLLRMVESAPGMVAGALAAGEAGSLQLLAQLQATFDLVTAMLTTLCDAASCHNQQAALAAAGSLLPRALRLALEVATASAPAREWTSAAKCVERYPELCYELASSGALDAALVCVQRQARMHKVAEQVLHTRHALLVILTIAAWLLEQRAGGSGGRGGPRDATGAAAAAYALIAGSPSGWAAASVQREPQAAEGGAGPPQTWMLARLRDADGLLQPLVTRVLPQLKQAAAARAAAGPESAQQLAVERCRALAGRKCANLGCTNVLLLVGPQAGSAAAASVAAAPKPRKCGGCRQVRYCGDECCRAD